MKLFFSAVRRELGAAAASASAWVFLTIFLALTSFCSFAVSGLYSSGQADLAPFFDWMPWLFLFLVPALTMPMWSEERRLGVFELTRSFPVSLGFLAFSKFAAGSAMLAAALFLTLPVPLTAVFLGSPDIGSIACGYFGVFILGTVYISLSLFCSSLSKSQTASFLLSLLFCGLFLFIGWERLTDLAAAYIPERIVSAVSSCGFLMNCRAFRKGVFDTSELVYSVSLSLFFIQLTRYSLEFVSAGFGSIFARGAFSDRLFGKTALRMILRTVYSLVLLCAVNIVCSEWKFSFDASSDSAYSVMPETRAILSGLGKRVTLRLYATSSDPALPQPMKKYAERVKWLLSELAENSNGNVVFRYIDPARNSGEEEAALLDGIKPLADSAGNRFFLGLSASYAEKVCSVPFLSELNESQLEYETVRAILNVAKNKTVQIGIISSLPVLGSKPDFSAVDIKSGEQFRYEQPWYIFAELNKDYTLVNIPADIAEIPEGLDALAVFHPSGISERGIAAIDKWISNGGKTAIFLDPRSFYAALKAKQEYSMIERLDSDLQRLTGAWGITMNKQLAAADMLLAYRKSLPDRLVTNPLVLNVIRPYISGSRVTSRINLLSVYFSGFFMIEKKEGIKTEVLYSTSENSSLASSMLCDRPELVIHNFKSGGKRLPLALRISGKLPSAFTGRPGKETEVYLFGDTDMAFNDVCVTAVPDLFGTKTLARGNDNAALIQNVIGALAGEHEGMAVLRSRVPMSRPMTAITRIKAEAELKYRNRIVALERELRMSQARLEYLRKEAGRGGAGADKFETEYREYKLKTGRAMRELDKLRSSLKAELNLLENRIRVINIIFVPAAVALAGIAWNIFRRRRRRGTEADK